MIAEFAAEHESFQVVSLGSGFDTRPFRLMSQPSNIKSYFEFDLQSVVEKKTQMTRKNLKLLNLITSSKFRYSLDQIDLEQGQEAFETILRRNYFDFECPTVFLAECVLLYLQPYPCNSILQMIQKMCNSIVIAFEQCNFNDPFGAKMLENLSSKGLLLKSAFQYPTLSSLTQRYGDLGFESVQAIDMAAAFVNYFTEDEKVRISNLELFDEYEEWDLVCRHYFFFKLRTRTGENKVI